MIMSKVFLSSTKREGYSRTNALSVYKPSANNERLELVLNAVHGKKREPSMSFCLKFSEF
ncbi:unnamed protein product [Amoebophrya sp. A25]|nr:unnamed protein product [Amoebophrya sp. A25]|eukprot:GSA25T00014570001.1